MKTVSQIMNEHDFEWMNTGGGCTAYVHEDESQYILITSREDVCIPESLDEACDVGLYDDDGECLKFFEADNVSHALHIAKSLITEVTEQ